MRVVVNQPTYIPWMGYFSMIDLADTFVFYDDVQLEHQSWQTRNRIKTGNGIQWLSIPIERNFGQKINETKIKSSYTWGEDHRKAIEQAYSKAPYFYPYWEYIQDFYIARWFYLADFTAYTIRILAELLNVKLPKWRKSSDMKLSGSKTDRLIDLLTQLKATEYISGLAAKDYIEPDKFDKAGIKLVWFDYKHPVYPQIRGEFVPYLSVLDLLFNTGEKAIEYIRDGYKITTGLD